MQLAIISPPPLSLFLFLQGVYINKYSERDRERDRDMQYALKDTETERQFRIQFPEM